MPKLKDKRPDEPLDGRQETFCQLMLEGKLSASAAYGEAGYEPKDANVNSAKIMAKDRIKIRIAYLRAERAEKSGVTRELLAQEYRDAYSVAQGQNSATGMVAATSGRARLYGLDKQVVEQQAPEQPLTATERGEAAEYAEFKLWQARQRKGKVVAIGA